MKSEDEDCDKPRHYVEKQRHYSADKGPYSQSCSLPSGHIWLWELDHKEDCASKNWCLWTVVLEKIPESPLDNKIKPVNFKGNQPWILIGRTDAKAPIFWSFDANSWLTGKVPDAGKDCRQKKKRASEDAMTGWHLRSNGRELGQTPGDGEGQGDLPCCGPWGRKESDVTGRLNNNNNNEIRKIQQQEVAWKVLASLAFIMPR